MADPTATPVVTDADKSPERIEREMEETRDSITQKVAALENQVLGTIQTATNTLTDTVQTVRDAPAAVKETVQETVAAVKDSVKETLTSVRESVASFSLTDCVRSNPGAALGTSAAFGFLTGYLLLGGRESRPLMARGYREPAPNGRPGTLPPDTAHHVASYASHTEPARPGMFAGLMAMVGGELEQLAKQALSNALASLKQSVNEKVPRMMDDAVQTLADRVTGHGPANGVGATAARAYPAGGL